MLALIRNKLPIQYITRPLQSIQNKNELLKATYSSLASSQTYRHPLMKSGLTMTHLHCFSSTSSFNTSLYLIRTTCQELLEIESILLDDLSVVFGTHYLPREKFSQEHLYNKNSEKVI